MPTAHNAMAAWRLVLAVAGATEACGYLGERAVRRAPGVAAHICHRKVADWAFLSDKGRCRRLWEDSRANSLDAEDGLGRTRRPSLGRDSVTWLAGGDDMDCLRRVADTQHSGGGVRAPFKGPTAEERNMGWREEGLSVEERDEGRRTS